MTTKMKNRAAEPRFYPGDDPLLEVIGTDASIGNLDRHTIKCEMQAEGVLFTIICPMSMATYCGEDGPVPVTVDTLEVLAAKQFFDNFGKETEEVDD